MNSGLLFDSQLLLELGVLDWGYTEEPIPRSFQRFDEWTRNKLHGPLGYLADHRKDLRADVRHYFPEFQSAVVFLFGYQQTKKWMLDHQKHQIAAYALAFEGEDYHSGLRQRLTILSERLPGDKKLISLDMQPVLERDLAFRAGLGWFGKNSMLINRKEGSYFLIGSILLDQKLDIPSAPIDSDHCGNCTACADACPTQAIDIRTRTLIANQCISTFTIEVMKEAPPPEGLERSRGEIFGCDICQDVCPWNRRPLERVVGKLSLKPALSFLREWFFEWPLEKLLEVVSAESERGFRKRLKGTPFDRPGKKGWLKNLLASSSQNDLSGTRTDVELPHSVRDEEDA